MPRIGLPHVPPAVTRAATGLARVAAAGVAGYYAAKAVVGEAAPPPFPAVNGSAVDPQVAAVIDEVTRRCADSVGNSSAIVAALTGLCVESAMQQSLETGRARLVARCTAAASAVMDAILIPMWIEMGCHYANHSSPHEYAFEAWSPGDHEYVARCLVTGVVTSAAVGLALGKVLPCLVNGLSEPVDDVSVFEPARPTLEEIAEGLANPGLGRVQPHAMPQAGRGSAFRETHEQLRPVMREALESASLELRQAQAMPEVRSERPDAYERGHGMLGPGTVRFAV